MKKSRKIAEGLAPIHAGLETAIFLDFEQTRLLTSLDFERVLRATFRYKE